VGCQNSVRGPRNQRFAGSTLIFGTPQDLRVDQGQSAETTGARPRAPTGAEARSSLRTLRARDRPVAQRALQLHRGLDGTRADPLGRFRRGRPPFDRSRIRPGGRSMAGDRRRAARRPDGSQRRLERERDARLGRHPAKRGRGAVRGRGRLRSAHRLVASASPLPARPALRAHGRVDWKLHGRLGRYLRGHRSREPRALPDGALYHPDTDTWQPLPASPLAPRYRATAVWTGEELVIWGGCCQETRARSFTTGAAIAVSPPTTYTQTIRRGRRRP
jgi:hypothetical protein